VKNREIQVITSLIILTCPIVRIFNPMRYTGFNERSLDPMVHALFDRYKRVLSSLIRNVTKKPKQIAVATPHKVQILAHREFRVMKK